MPRQQVARVGPRAANRLMPSSGWLGWAPELPTVLCLAKVAREGLRASLDIVAKINIPEVKVLLAYCTV
jgi:hypothetical protein